jgi:hypothetical protein
VVRALLASELFEKDRWGAFKDFIRMEDAKEEGLLPEIYHESFPNICLPKDGGCGSEIIVSVDSTNPNERKIGARVTCCNPRCKIKIGYTLHHMMTRFGCKNVGERTCLNIVDYAYDYLQLKSHVEVLYFDDKYLFPDIKGMSFVHFNQALHKIKSTNLTFPDMVSRLGIPGFDSNAIKVLDGINTVVELIEIVKANGGIKSFLYQRGIEDPMKVFYFHEFLQDILHAEHKVFKNLIPIGKIKISVCITGNLNLNGIRITAPQFIELCNTVGIVGNVRLFEVVENTAIQTTSFVIADYESTSRKYLKAREREGSEGKYLPSAEEGGEPVYENRKIIYSSREFIDWLREVVSKCGLTTNEPPEEMTKMEIIQ